MIKNIQVVFWMLNHAEMNYSDDESTALILDIAAGKLAEKYLLVWLQQHLV